MQNRWHIIYRLSNIISVWDTNYVRLLAATEYNYNFCKNRSNDDVFKNAIEVIYNNLWSYVTPEVVEYYDGIDMKDSNVDLSRYTSLYGLEKLKDKSEFLTWIYNNVMENLESIYLKFDFYVESFDCTIKRVLEDAGFYCYNDLDGSLGTIDDFRCIDNYRFEGLCFAIDIRRFLPGYNEENTLFTDEMKPYCFEDNGVFRENYYHDAYSYPYNETFMEMLKRCYCMENIYALYDGDTDFTGIEIKDQTEFASTFIKYVMPCIYKIDLKERYDRLVDFHHKDLVMVFESVKTSNSVEDALGIKKKEDKETI